MDMLGRGWTGLASAALGYYQAVGLVEFTMIKFIAAAPLIGLVAYLFWCAYKDWQWHTSRCKVDGSNPWFSLLRMRKNIVSLSRNGFIRRSFRRLWLNKFYDLWLAVRPRVKELPNGGIYRSINTEGVSLALEILEGGNCYPLDWIPFPVTTFADLGCNVGYFPVWLANHEGHKILGIMIDANRDVLTEAGWHIRENHWKDIRAYYGLIGSDKPFYIAPSNTCSTAHLDRDLAPKDWVAKCTAVSVSPINVEQIWASSMPAERCHLLKIDIEGSEYEFLRREQKFMERVDAVLIECHTYVEPFENAVQLLRLMGFGEPIIFEQLSQTLVAGFLRRK